MSPGIVVMVDESILGVLADGPLERAKSLHASDAETTRVDAVCERVSSTLKPSDIVACAAQTMDADDVGAIVVVDDDGAPVGIVTIDDLR